MTVTVVDEAGRLVLSVRGDRTGFFTPETSRAKAVAAAAFRRPTKELAELVAQGGFWAPVPAVQQGQLLPTLGGTPLAAARSSEGSAVAAERANRTRSAPAPAPPQ